VGDLDPQPGTDAPPTITTPLHPRL
jgi:hypothetical protein